MLHFSLQKRLLTLALAAAMIAPAFALIALPTVEAVAICEDPIRDFPGGPGRRPGATPVPVFIRQSVKNEQGTYVFAITEAQLADTMGDAIEFRVDVKNTSAFDVGFVELEHAYRTVREGPQLVSIADVEGGTYVPTDHMFVVDRVPAGSTVSLTYTLILSRAVDASVMQSAVLLDDFMVLDPQSRYPQRYPETAIGRHRTTIERVGIGGKEVSCFTGENADRYALPGQRDTVAPSSSLPAASSVRPAQNSVVLTPEQIRGKLTVSIRADSGSAYSGDTVRYFISVQNATDGIFRDTLIDSRFDASLLQVVDAGGGVATRAGIQWLIDTLNPGETWNVTYDVRVNGAAPQGRNVPSTVSLFSGDLLDVPTSALTRSTDLLIAGQSFTPISSQETAYTVYMPQTGASITAAIIIVMQALFGIIMACALYCLTVRILWRRLV